MVKLALIVMFVVSLATLGAAAASIPAPQAELPIVTADAL